MVISVNVKLLMKTSRVLGNYPIHISLRLLYDKLNILWNDYGAESLIRLHVNLLFLISSIFCVYLETLAPKNRLKYKNDCP